MKYLYCDSCFLITISQGNMLAALSQYKDQFFISDTQVKEELIRPEFLAQKVRKSVTVILEDRQEIKEKTRELASLYSTLSFFDCLCMAYALLDGYCLITDDKALAKKCMQHNIEVKNSELIIAEFGLGGVEYEEIR